MGTGQMKKHLQEPEALLLGWEENPPSPFPLLLNLESQALSPLWWWGEHPGVALPRYFPSPSISQMVRGHGTQEPAWFCCLANPKVCFSHSQLFPRAHAQTSKCREAVWSSGECVRWRQHPPVLHVLGNYSPAARGAELSRCPVFII